MTSPTIGIEMIVGYGHNMDEAVQSAKILANEYLHTHQWICADGRSCYHVTTTISVIGNLFCCLISFVGPTTEIEWGINAQR